APPFHGADGVPGGARRTFPARPAGPGRRHGGLARAADPPRPALPAGRVAGRHRPACRRTPDRQPGPNRHRREPPRRRRHHRGRPGRKGASRRTRARLQQHRVPRGGARRPPRRPLRPAARFHPHRPARGVSARAGGGGGRTDPQPSGLPRRGAAHPGWAARRHARQRHRGACRRGDDTGRRRRRDRPCAVQWRRGRRDGDGGGPDRGVVLRAGRGRRQRPRPAARPRRAGAGAGLARGAHLPRGGPGPRRHGVVRPLRPGRPPRRRRGPAAPRGASGGHGARGRGGPRVARVRPEPRLVARRDHRLRGGGGQALGRRGARRRRPGAAL
ncbi:MAG: BUG/TctC family periplasmic protein, partial [uncultured Acetobacteraceae bacterium]